MTPSLPALWLRSCGTGGGHTASLPGCCRNLRQPLKALWRSTRRRTDNRTCACSNWNSKGLCRHGTPAEKKSKKKNTKKQSKQMSFGCPCAQIPLEARRARFGGSQAVKAWQRCPGAWIKKNGPIKGFRKPFWRIRAVDGSERSPEAWIKEPAPVRGFRKPFWRIQAVEGPKRS